MDIKNIVKLEDCEREMLRQVGLTRYYKRGENIFCHGDPADRVYLIESGWVKIFRINGNGRYVTVGSIRQPGEMMGLAEALHGVERTCNAGAVTDVQLVTIYREKFFELLECETLLALKVAKLLAFRMRDAEMAVHEIVTRQVAGRLATLLLKFAESCGQQVAGGITIEPRFTHEELAAMIGASRQTVTAILTAMRDEQCVEIEGGSIKITNWHALQRFIS
ncbi:Crp/Fnr family transcriptional regulator [Desulfoscipio geothermicus]|uniref:cAMP-binding domain of CRP or a regulatory subunit of cAMP-dependent protein kinases n=1 Tax=Desulfoscipio geothermicus DSM 3669 TaxID=1121426 RepID=A0A1I6D195_9FIRM|nr:Crp/Fnr family transcriptional regulator [Desulfoscipio geothermicus]SFQ99276.1 cAMP-binding domain of CRP or a regulatory subunit of cAMP-dependent protein kinases [Desulfoscipio geothermicus DSM 3669]